MSKLLLDKNYEKQLLAFVIIQPLIDIYRVFFESKIQFLGIALSEWINFGAFGYLCILFIVKYFRRVKYYIPLIAYGVIFLVYFALHAWNILQFDENILNDTDINVLKELYFMLRVYLIPLVVFYMMLCAKITMTQFEKVANCLSWMISGVIVITNLLKISFISYAGTLEKNTYINRNIIEWFTNPDLENIAYMTSKGWFYMGNQIGVILFVLYPFTVMCAMKYKNIKSFVLMILQGIAMIMVSTKVAAIGCILILIVAIMIGIVFGLILNQFSFGLKDVMKFLCVGIGLVLLLVNSPIITMQGQRENAYIIDEEEQALKEEVKKMEKELKQEGNVNKALIRNFAKVIAKHPYAYGIEREFIELFDVEENYMFWYNIVISENNAHVDYRRLKTMIYEEVLRVNDNKYDRWLGIGYTSNFPYMEKDPHGQNVWFGYLGTLVLIGPYFLCVSYVIFYILKHRKTNLHYENAFFAVSLGGISVLGLMAGHLFFGIFSIVIFAFLVASFYHIQKEMVLE